MKTALVTATILASLGFAVNHAQAEGTRTEWMPCAQEDSVNCVWDARHMGNGVGHSYFTDRDGNVHRLPHAIAHYLLYDGR